MRTAQSLLSIWCYDWYCVSLFPCYVLQRLVFTSSPSVLVRMTHDMLWLALKWWVPSWGWVSKFLYICVCLFMFSTSLARWNQFSWDHGDHLPSEFARRSPVSASLRASLQDVGRFFWTGRHDPREPNSNREIMFGAHFWCSTMPGLRKMHLFHTWVWIIYISYTPLASSVRFHWNDGLYRGN